MNVSPATASETLAWSHKAVRILSETHRDNRHSKALSDADLLVSPTALVEILREQGNQYIHALESMLDLALPCQRWFNIFMGHKARNPVLPQAFFQFRSLFLVFSLVSQKVLSEVSGHRCTQFKAYSKGLREFKLLHSKKTGSRGRWIAMSEEQLSEAHAVDLEDKALIRKTIEDYRQQRKDAGFEAGNEPVGIPTNSLGATDHEPVGEPTAG